MVFTKEKAIQLTYELWSWMEENKKTDKGGWPGWQKYGRMRAECPCCQYVKENGSFAHLKQEECIKLCPLLNIWPAKVVSMNVPCCRKGSPFEKFEDLEEAEQYDKMSRVVSKMVFAIKKEMKRLKIKPLKEAK
jgi:hypothetical protein